MTNITEIKALINATTTTFETFGVAGEKVFISDVYEDIKNNICCSLEEFKALLVAANKEQEVVLSRCDMVAAFDAKKVAKSLIEIKIGGITVSEVAFINI